VVLLGLAALLLGAMMRPVQAQGGRPQWEYKCIKIGPTSLATREAKFNVLGADGWELTESAAWMNDSSWCFKRRR
jgi:hypothetical protein